MSEVTAPPFQVGPAALPQWEVRFVWCDKQGMTVRPWTIQPDHESGWEPFAADRDGIWLRRRVQPPLQATHTPEAGKASGTGQEPLASAQDAVANGLGRLEYFNPGSQRALTMAEQQYRDETNWHTAIRTYQPP